MIEQARKTAVKAAKFTKRVAVAITRAVLALVTSLISLVGGGVLFILFLLVILVAAIVNSPFGIFFAEEPNAPDTVSAVQAVNLVNIDFAAYLEALQSGSYDGVVVHGQQADTVEVVAVFSARTAGSDTDGADVATLDEARVNRLKAVFWDMTQVETEVEEIYHPGETEEDSGWTEYILHIFITPKTAQEMKSIYSFTQYQITALDELLADRVALSALIGSLSITDADVRALLAALPADLSPERQETVRHALTLYGKVTYFWGGKSHVKGWDSRWGSIRQVTAAGSSTSGCYLPYGLDCSGYIDWVFINTMDYVLGHGGGVRAQHEHSTNIPISEALPGDLAFYDDDSHIGIIVGWTVDGELLVTHCSFGANNVVIGEFYAHGFSAVGRPDAFD